MGLQIKREISVTDIPRETIELCTMGGVDATPYVADALKELDVTFTNPDAVRTCLRAYGAWEAEELADDAENAARMFWIICGDFSEYLVECDGIGHDPYTQERPEGFEPNAGSDYFYIEG